MSEWLRPFAESAAALAEMLGIIVILGFALYTLAYAGLQLLRKKGSQNLYRDVRHRLGRGILLGLEFLVAADIIHTVAVELSYHSVGLLAVVLLIRTFLSFTLEVELDGRWPWQRPD
jgi:uncharacterized membrane protein